MKDVLLMLANAVNPKRSLGHWSGSLKKADGRKQMVPANGKNQSVNKWTSYSSSGMVKGKSARDREALWDSIGEPLPSRT